MSTTEEIRRQNFERFERNKNDFKQRMKDGSEKNPCYEEGQLTLRCLHNTKDKSECEEYGKNVRMCRYFWRTVMKDRKRKGIMPVLPAVDDREKVMEEYKHLLENS
ncbi:coiled-coil-helix-coiled-coil-helix domain-containing protein 7-like [Ruditapes philippinarum]|uniref:coiled-coil-helix-coiled-coil-helix domain-containing protein 7-like n=1 Tax=Ruditapes philippinarum TaxID=129788 RepID=UPI00295B2B96|nr:coiled-coil-helix-coiled-coil-helix domain-containing protein 7-like [Ruditapes philippinarum]